MGGVESDYSVCPRPFLQFLQFCQFMLVRLHQVTAGYSRLHQVTSDYVSLCWRDGTWSSTIFTCFSMAEYRELVRYFTQWTRIIFKAFLPFQVLPENL